MAMAVVIAGCGGGHDFRQRPGVGLDAAADHVADRGSDGPALGSDGPMTCFVPTDCSAGQTCCVMLEGGSGTVSCQPSALCVPGDYTWLACATDADCPAALSKCTEIATTPEGFPFRICE